MEWDLTGYQETASYTDPDDIIPGWYRVRVTRVEDGASSVKQTPMRYIYMESSTDQFAGMIREQIPLLESTKFRLAALLKALGFTPEDRKYQIPEGRLIGRELDVKLGHRIDDSNPDRRYVDISKMAAAGRFTNSQAPHNQFQQPQHDQSVDEQDSSTATSDAIDLTEISGL